MNSKSNDNVDRNIHDRNTIDFTDVVDVIEVTEDWVDGCIDVKQLNCLENEVELIEVGEDWVDRYIESRDVADQTDCFENIELIEVGEDWVDRKCEQAEANLQKDEFHIDEQNEINDISEGRIAELKMSLTETKYNSSFNKKGAVRKRKVFKMPLKQRLLIKKQLKQEKHHIREPCMHDDCNSISFDRRKAINTEFWNMGFSERYTFGIHTIHRLDIRFRRKNTPAVKNSSYLCFLRNDRGEMKRVCKVFYLTTLGFSKSNDNFIKTSVGQDRFQVPLPRSINRTDNLQLKRPDYDSIIAHINSYKPNVSHHRREHAPKKKYLPETLTIQSIYDDFQKQHENIKCSYYLYRRIVSNELNISFAKLGHEKCETCEEYFLHTQCVAICSTCDLCVEYQIHKTKYTESRELYDVQRVLNTEKKAFYSGDMEKVIMLPRLEMFKQTIFTTRLSAYNDTFAPLGGTENNPSASKPVAILWHEGISGRCKEDIISAFYKFFLLKKDAEECVLWLDNCSSQNKNWALFTFLIYIINCDLVKIQKIQFNYFEPGHTFMSADSFHHQVELSMKEMNKVYDFEDFETAVSKANSGNVIVLPMMYSDFKKWPDLSSRPKKQLGQHYMHEIVQVTATRGSYDLTYKKSFTSAEEFTLNFLQEKFRTNGIPSPEQLLKSDCGIPKQRKENILKLSGILKDDKIQFYRDLQVIETAIPTKALKAEEDENKQRKSIPRRSQKSTESVDKSEKVLQKPTEPVLPKSIPLVGKKSNEFAEKCESLSQRPTEPVQRKSIPLRVKNSNESAEKCETLSERPSEPVQRKPIPLRGQKSKASVSEKCETLSQRPSDPMQRKPIPQRGQKSKESAEKSETIQQKHIEPVQRRSMRQRDRKSNESIEQPKKLQRKRVRSKNGKRKIE